MTDRPIIFSAPMVKALLLDGRKTQTRRVLKPQPPAGHNFLGIYAPHLTAVFADGNPNHDHTVRLPSRRDRLYVRETYAHHPCAKHMVSPKGDFHPWGSPIYRATFGAMLDPKCEGFSRWIPSIHMPRWASRLTLVVTDVRVQRVQEISEEDARAEGIEWATDDNRLHKTARVAFSELWDSLNAKRGYGWDANPWVVALTFTVHHQNVDAMEAAHG